MPSTIITKNGSGAPLAADLVAGELAVDLTNGRLYTEDSGGSVIEIGLNPSGNVDVTGTVTADGLTVLGTDTTLVASIGTDAQRVYITPDGTEINYNASGNSAGSHMFQTGNVNRLNIASNGDISFYEDTGTTAKLFWDASAESLGLGSTTPDSGRKLHIEGDDTTVGITLKDTAGTQYGIKSDANSFIIRNDNLALDRLVIDTAGNVGIGGNGVGNQLGLYINRGATTNFFEASDNTKTFIGGTDSGNAYVKTGSLSAHPVGIVQGNVPAIYIDTSKNVGIGTESPVSFGANTAGLTVNGSLGSHITWQNNGTNVAFAYTAGNNFLIGSEQASSDTIFIAAGLEAMRIVSSGNVGIDATPSSWGSIFKSLDISGSSVSSTTAGALVQSGNAYYNGTNWIYKVDGPATRVELNASTSGSVWYTAASGTAGATITTFNPSMTLDASGNLLVGTTAVGVGTARHNVYSDATVNTAMASILVNQSGALNGTPVQRVYHYEADGATSATMIQFVNRGVTQVGAITSTGSATNYGVSSDYRLKENVVAMSGATERLKQLKPSRFNFIANPDTTVDGFLAHEVQDVVPEAITGTKDAVDAEGNPEYQNIDQSKLVPLLVATIQELEARIAALEGAN